MTSRLVIRMIKPFQLFPQVIEVWPEVWVYGPTLHHQLIDVTEPLSRAGLAAWAGDISTTRSHRSLPCPCISTHLDTMLSVFVDWTGLTSNTVFIFLVPHPRIRLGACTQQLDRQTDRDRPDTHRN